MVLAAIVITHLALTVGLLLLLLAIVASGLLPLGLLLLLLFLVRHCKVLLHRPVIGIGKQPAARRGCSDLCGGPLESAPDPNRRVGER